MTSPGTKPGVPRGYRRPPAERFGTKRMPDEEAARGDRATHTTEEFDASYAGTPPWDIGGPQAAFLRLAHDGLLTGEVLDAGCGTGEHALMTAELGLSVTGVDTAPTAIEIAKDKARSRKLDARFVVADALDLTALGAEFDTILDCGLFHVFDNAGRARYVESLAAVLRPNGRFFMLCFSDAQPGDFGPRRVSQEEIRSNFVSGWQVESIEAATLELTINDAGAIAWLATIRRVASL